MDTILSHKILTLATDLMTTPVYNVLFAWGRCFKAARNGCTLPSQMSAPIPTWLRRLGADTIALVRQKDVRGAGTAHPLGVRGRGRDDRDSQRRFERDHLGVQGRCAGTPLEISWLPYDQSLKETHIFPYFPRPIPERNQYFPIFSHDQI